MGKTAHTPTPWKWAQPELLSYAGGMAEWGCLEGPDPLAEAKPILFACGPTRKGARPRHRPTICIPLQADADFILRACNCHEELVEVCKAYEAAMQRAADDGNEVSVASGLAFCQARQLAKAAIAKATPQRPKVGERVRGPE